MKKRTWLYWLIAVFITLSAAYYQKITGPTYPLKGKFEKNGNVIEYKFIRSAESNGSNLVSFHSQKQLNATLLYKRYKTNDEWTSIKMKDTGGEICAYLPSQPPAGKLIYYISIEDTSETYNIPEEQVVVRFKGAVPQIYLLPHIFLIFLAMLFSNLAGVMAIFRKGKYRLMGFIAFVTMMFGGMILGPLVQKAAFGDYWTGVPFGYDLTDNKTLIAFVFWIAAMWLNRKKNRPIWIILAAIITLIIFSIPHSLFGSELNYTTGTVTQG